MTPANPSGKPKSTGHILIGGLVCLIILAGGAAGMAALSGKKSRPLEKEAVQAPLAVEALSAAFEDTRVHLTGFGEVAALNTVTLSPEVSGMVVSVAPNLEEGEYVKKGEILFTIDSRDYIAAKTRAEISVRQSQNKISRLRIQQKTDKSRLGVLSRNARLAGAEYTRLAKLYKKEQVGTLSGVEKAEQSRNALIDSEKQLSQTIDLYPLLIEEARNTLVGAQADLETAALNVKRCTVRAPFDARVKAVALEERQFVSRGASLITLADDSVLEIQVPMNSADVARWISFESLSENANWFAALEKIRCIVEVNDGGERIIQTATVNRIVKYDPKTRTTTIAVRIEKGPETGDKRPSFPVVDGMFCTVKIPGKLLTDTVKLPSAAVSMENTVHIAENGRLKTVAVTPAMDNGEHVYISDGIDEGDLVIVTKLVNPLENTLLAVTERPGANGDRALALNQAKPFITEGTSYE